MARKFAQADKDSNFIFFHNLQITASTLFKKYFYVFKMRFVFS